ncbi:hypothetical protein BDR04DRAFT_1117545 [Suillus decipiens]|nr:hypothetical protein BDR04DRAFT_1117545 [Suillus decipiens]
MSSSKSALPSAIQMPKVSKMSPLPGSGPLKLTWGVRITHGMRNLWTKALQDRWKEEIDLVQLEMNWTCNFFLWKAGQWGDWISNHWMHRQHLTAIFISETTVIVIANVIILHQLYAMVQEFQPLGTYDYPELQSFQN